MNLTIRTKLYWGAILSLLMATMLATLNVYVSRESSTALSNMYEQVVVPSGALQEMSDSLRQIELEMDKLLSGRVSMVEARMDLKRNRQQLSDAWSRFRETQGNFPISKEEL